MPWPPGISHRHTVLRHRQLVFSGTVLAVFFRLAVASTILLSNLYAVAYRSTHEWRVMQWNDKRNIQNVFTIIFTLQYLINTLADCATSIDMLCNTDKAVCMVFPPKDKRKVVTPTFPAFKLDNMFTRITCVNGFCTPWTIPIQSFCLTRPSFQSCAKYRLGTVVQMLRQAACPWRHTTTSTGALNDQQ